MSFIREIEVEILNPLRSRPELLLLVGWETEKKCAAYSDSK